MLHHVRCLISGELKSETLNNCHSSYNNNLLTRETSSCGLTGCFSILVNTDLRMFASCRRAFKLLPEFFKKNLFYINRIRTCTYFSKIIIILSRGKCLPVLARSKSYICVYIFDCVRRLYLLK